MKRALVLIASAAALIAAVLVIWTYVYVAALDSYEPGNATQQIVVYPVLGVGDAVLWAIARETSTDVTPYIFVWRYRGPKVALALFPTVPMQLGEELGDRRVLDPDGLSVRQRTTVPR